MTRAAIINFHGIGTPPAGLPDGEDKYWVSPDAFRAFLDMCCLGGERTITFDDGNMSDFEHGVPALEKRGLRGEFFVCAGRIGKPGYLGRAELERMADAGHTIGSHGRDHVAWTGLDAARLHDETVVAAQEIGAASGRPVTGVAIPFGRYDRRVLGKLEEAGFAEVYSSDGAPRLSPHGAIPRHSVRSDLPMEEQFAWFLRPLSLTRRAVQEAKLRLKALR